MLDREIAVGFAPDVVLVRRESSGSTMTGDSGTESKLLESSFTFIVTGAR